MDRRRGTRGGRRDRRRWGEGDVTGIYLLVRTTGLDGPIYLALAMKNVQLALPRARTSSLIHAVPIKLSRDINLPLVCTHAGEYNFQTGLTSNSRLFFSNLSQRCRGVGEREARHGRIISRRIISRRGGAMNYNRGRLGIGRPCWLDQLSANPRSRGVPRVGPIRDRVPRSSGVSIIEYFAGGFGPLFSPEHGSRIPRALERIYVTRRKKKKKKKKKSERENKEKKEKKEGGERKKCGIKMRPRPRVISRVFQLNLLEAAIRLINPFARADPSAYFVAGRLSRINGHAALIPPDTHGTLRKPEEEEEEGGGRTRVYGHARSRDLMSRISKNPRPMDQREIAESPSGSCHCQALSGSSHD